ncbi:MAG: hypothetical protein ABI467_32225 [Kofleriaceae bacterium]
MTPATVTGKFSGHARAAAALTLAMIEFFIGGGWAMFLVLAIAIPMLVTAAKFARDATPHRLSLVRALTTAIVFAALAGVAVDLASVARHVVAIPELRKDLVDNLLQGFNESMAPAILAFPLVAITWILVAFGVRRMPNP